MALPSWASQSITRVRPGTTTSRGSTIYDWTNTQTVVISGCSVQPASTGLSQDGRVLGISEGLTIYLPPGSDVQEGDRIIYEGKIYTITGMPKSWQSPTGLVSNMQINVERWKG